MDPNQEQEVIQKALDILGEQYECVQLFASRHEAGQDNGTVRIDAGVGNHLARYGHVRDWLIRSEEKIKVDVRNESLEDMDDDESA